MIPLALKMNVTPPNVDYPRGDIKNNSGANDGTPVDRNVYGDIHQFFEKMFAESGLTANNMLDNETNGYQLYEALYTLFGATSSTALGTIAGSPVSVLNISEFEVSKYGKMGSIYFGGAVTIDTADVSNLNTGNGFIQWTVTIPAGFTSVRIGLGVSPAFANNSGNPYKAGQIYCEKLTATTVRFRFTATQAVAAGDIFVFAFNSSYRTS
jgi:hypothetical protein